MQIKSKGKLSTEELNQLAEAGIGAKRYIARGLGFGSDDASLQKMSKMLEGGKIGSDLAIGFILEGMNEYSGMMQTTAKETLSGIRSNLEDTFEINIFRRWGQGLQEGAKQGLGVMVDLLDKNERKLQAFGDTLQGIGADISKYLADRFRESTERLMDLTDNSDFKRADLFGKMSMAWDKVIAEPFGKWWDGSGGAAFRERAQSFGESIGNSLARGAIVGFKGLLGNASKLIPGGQSADAMSWLSGAILFKGANGLGAGKLLGKLGGRVFGGGAVGAEGAAATGMSLSTGATLGGFAIGGVGLLSAVNDLNEAARTINNKTRQDYMVQGATKAGMVAAGTALGAAIGSIIPGLGTLLGAGLGAGFGGLGALVAGGGIGQAISDASDGTTKLRELSEAARDAKTKVDEAHTAASDFSLLVEKYRQTVFVLQLSESSTNLTIEQGLKDRLTEIQEQAGNIEAKLKGGGLNKTDKSNLQSELDDLSLKEITIKALVGGPLFDEDKTKLDNRITELEGNKIDVETRLTQPEKLSQNDITALETKRSLINAELTNLKAAVGTLDTTNIADDLSELQKEKQFLLKVKADGMYDSLDDQTQNLVKKALLENGIAELTFQLKATSLSESEKNMLTEQLRDISLAAETASNGLINQQNLLNDKYDISIDRLEEIARLKLQEAQFSDAQLAQNVYQSRSSYPEYEEKLAAQREEMEKNLSKADQKLDIYRGLSTLRGQVLETRTENQLAINSGAKLETNELGLTAKQMEDFSSKVFELADKYDELRYGRTNPRWFLDDLKADTSTLMQKKLAEAGQLREASEQSMSQYYQTQSEYGNLYTNELDMVKRNSERRYGGTYDELARKFFSGTDNDRNSFLKMMQGIGALSDRFSGLDEGFKFGGDKFVESMRPYITGDVVQAFAGRSKVSGTDPLSQLNNYLVGLGGQGAAGLFEADRSSITDVSSKISANTATKEEIKSMQETLKKYGYDIGGTGADGFAGKNTLRAMKQFQDDVTTGKLSIDTLPESVSAAKTSIDGLSASASAFASWVNANLPTSGVGGGTGGSGTTRSESSLSDTLGTTVDAMSSASNKYTANAQSATGAMSSLTGAANGTTSALGILDNRLRAFGRTRYDGQYASGGIVSRAETALIGEDGPEAIIPLSERRRNRGMSLWKAAGQALGVRMYAAGGIVGDVETPAAPKAGVSVQIGSIPIEVSVHGGSDSGSIMEAIKAQMPAVANEIAERIARGLEKTYSNMPVEV